MHTYTHTHTHVHTSIHTYIRTYIHTYTHKPTHMHAYIHACIHTSVHQYTHIHIYMHAYTHTYDIRRHTHTCRCAIAIPPTSSSFPQRRPPRRQPRPRPRPLPPSSCVSGTTTPSDATNALTCRLLSSRGSPEISEEEARSLLAALQPTGAASGGSLDLSRRNNAATPTGAASGSSAEDAGKIIELAIVRH